MAKEISAQAQLHVDAFKRSNPGATKDDFAEFIARSEKQYTKDNPTMWPTVKAELEEALKGF